MVSRPILPVCGGRGRSRPYERSHCVGTTPVLSDSFFKIRLGVYAFNEHKTVPNFISPSTGRAAARPYKNHICGAGIRNNLLICLLVFTLTLVIFTRPVTAQEHHLWEVYIIRSGGDDAQLLFLDLLSGDVTTVQVTGERFTPLGQRVLYYDTASRTMMTAAPDGSVQPHPFIQLGAARRVDWIVAPDQRQIAWTLTYAEGDSLRTETYVATPGGTEQRLVLADGGRTDGVRALPVAFSADNSALIMDAHPDLIGDLAPYTQYARLFQVNLSTSEIELLPDDGFPCFCGAAVRAGLLLRLSVTADLRGFELLLFDLDSGTQRTIDAYALPNYTQAGDILISPDGDRAVYALSQIENFGTPDQRISTIFMLVNLETMTQQPLTERITTFVHPLRWTEDHTAVIFTSPLRDGTWKVSLADGVLSNVAQATLIGTLRD